MLKILISSSILICVLVLLRLLTGNRVDPRLRYALWLLVALRLLIPFSISVNTVSEMNPLPQQTYIQEAPLPVADVIEYEPYTAVDGSVVSEASSPNKISNPNILLYVWLIGASAAAIWFAVRNTLFYVNLKRTRRPVSGLGRDVYISDYVSSPCLFGLFRPAVYLTPETAADARSECILAHERTHIAHGDHIWALLRTVCLVVYWFNPLVWLSAYLSRQDGELACDAGAVKKLGMERRTEYGDMILDVLSMGVNSARSNIAVAMASKRGVRERVSMLSGIRKTSALATIALLAAVVLTACAAFTESNPEPSPVPSGMPEYVGTTSTDRIVYDLLDAQIKRIIAGERDPGGPPFLTATLVCGTNNIAKQGNKFWRIDGEKVWQIWLDIAGVKRPYDPYAGDTAKILELLNPKGWTSLDREPGLEERMANADDRHYTTLHLSAGDLDLGLCPGSCVGYYSYDGSTVWMSVDSSVGSDIMSLFKTDATISTLLGTGSEISVIKDGRSIVLDSETRAEAEALLMDMDVEKCAALPYEDGGEAFFKTGKKNNVTLCGSYGKVVWFSISGPSGSGLFVGPYFDEYEALMKIWQDAE